MLLRCAPLGFAIRQAGRFVATTLSLAARRLTGQRIPEAAVFRLRVRLRALLGVARAARWAIQTRRVIGKGLTVPRATVIETWLGRRLRD
jgi:hypothetical protein